MRVFAYLGIGELKIIIFDEFVSSAGQKPACFCLFWFCCIFLICFCDTLAEAAWVAFALEFFLSRRCPCFRATTKCANKLSVERSLALLLPAPLDFCRELFVPVETPAPLSLPADAEFTRAQEVLVVLLLSLSIFFLSASFCNCSSCRFFSFLFFSFAKRCFIIHAFSVF